MSILSGWRGEQEARRAQFEAESGQCGPLEGAWVLDLVILSDFVIRPSGFLQPRLLPRLVSKKCCSVCAKDSAVLNRKVSTPARWKARSNSASRSAFVSANFLRTVARVESSSNSSPVSASSIVSKPAEGNTLSRG